MSRLPLALALAAGLAASLPAASASADWYIGIGAGPTLRLDGWPNQVRVEQDIGYSFGGRSGFFLSFHPSQSWANDFVVAAFPLGIGGLFDVYRSVNFTFQLGPMGMLGFAISDDFDGPRDLDPWFYFGASFILRFLLLRNRLGIYVKPIGLEFGVGDDRSFYGRIEARYYLTAGIQLYF